MLGAMLIWGINITSAKVAVHDVPPLGFGLLRYTFASSVLFFILWRREGSIGVHRGDLPWLAASGIIGLGLNQVAFLSGIHLVSATLAAIILASAPVLTAVVAAIWAREPLRLAAMTSLFVSLAGVTLVILGKGDRLSISGPGSALMLLAAATLALGAVLARVPLRAYSSLRVTAWLTLFGALTLSAPGLPAWLTTPWTSLPGLTWLAIGFTLVFATILGNLTWNYAIQQLGAARTAAYTYLQPIGGVAFAAVLLGERPTWLQVVGGLIVLSGQVVYSLGRRPPATPSPED